MQENFSSNSKDTAFRLAADLLRNALGVDGGVIRSLAIVINNQWFHLRVLCNILAVAAVFVLCSSLCAAPSQGPGGLSGVFHVEAGAHCNANTNYEWYTELDDYTIADGYSYFVEGKAYNWGGQQGCWFIERNMDITINCPKKIEGTLYLYCVDYDGNKRSQTITVNGNYRDILDDFGPITGKWLEYKLSKTDTSDGTIEIEITRNRGANVVISRLDFVPNSESVIKEAKWNPNRHSVKDMVERDWLRQDIIRLRQIWMGGRLGFATCGSHLSEWNETAIRWEGLGDGVGRVVPVPMISMPPKIDARLDDLCWSFATRLYSPLRDTPGSKPNNSFLLLCCDENNLYIGLSSDSKHHVYFSFGNTRVYFRSMGEATVLINGKRADKVRRKATTSERGEPQHRTNPRFILPKEKITKGPSVEQWVELKAFIKGKRTIAEIALPLRQTDKDGVIQIPTFSPLFFGSQESDHDLRKIASSPIRLKPANFGLAWASPRPFSFGKNVLELQVIPASPFKKDVEMDVELLICPRAKPDKRVLLKRTITAPTGNEDSRAKSPSVGSISGNSRTKVNLRFDIKSEGAGTVVVSLRQGKSVFRDGFVFYVSPLSEVLERGKALVNDLKEYGAVEEAQAAARKLANISEARDALVLRSKMGELTTSDWRRLYLKARWAVRDIAFRNPLLDFNELLFVKRFTPNQAHQCAHHLGTAQRPGGGICILSGLSPDGKVRNIIGDKLPPGGFGRPDLSFDAKRVVFPYSAPSPQPSAFRWLTGYTHGLCEPYNVYEIRIDGTGLRKLTDGPFENTEPCYLPNGRIAFTSSRCRHLVQCGDWAIAFALYSMNRDGSDVHQLTLVKEGEWFPSVLDDGRIIYTRWEYMMKAFNAIQYLWTVWPDGTHAKMVYGDQYAFSAGPVVFAEARQIPGTTKVICTGAAHHNCGVGPICIVDLGYSRGRARGLYRVTPEVGYPETSEMSNVTSAAGFYNSPYPLSENYFLVSYSFETNHSAPIGYGIYLMDIYGGKELIYRDTAFSCYSPIPLKPRKIPHTLPMTLTRNNKSEDGTMLLLDIYRGLKGIPRGTVKYLRIVETLPKLTHTVPDRIDVGIGSGWDPRMVLGTVPVESDGSAYFHVPVGKAVFFEALDEDYLEVRRMRSFINIKPGEVVTCVGCHESHSSAPANVSVLALSRAPSEITLPPWGRKTMSFPKLVQPVLDRYCVDCHDGSNGKDKSFDLSSRKVVAATGAQNSGPPIPVYSSFTTLLKYVSYVKVSGWGGGRLPMPPRSIGSYRSKLMKILRRGHYGTRLDRCSWRIIAAWIDCNAPYLGSWEGLVRKEMTKK